MSHRTKATKEIRDEAERLGYVLEGLTARGHLKWRHRLGFFAITGSAVAGTQRHTNNAISELRRRARQAEQKC